MKKIILSVLIMVVLSFSVAAEWEKQDSHARGYNLNAVEAVTDNLVFAVGNSLPPGSNGVILRTTDGSTWGIVYTPDEHLYDICAFDDNEVLAVGSGPSIFKSDNGGSSWDPVETGLERSGTIWGAYCIEDVAYAIGDLFSNDNVNQRVLLKSTNKGGSWTPVNIESRGLVHDAKFFTEELGYIVGADSKVYRTSDGETFRVNTELDIVSLRAIDCTDANNCWVVGSGRIIFRTRDGGTIEWTEHDTIDATAGFHSVYFQDRQTGWIGGQNMIKKTIDGGDTWEIDRADISYSNGHIPTAYVNGIDFANGVGYAVGEMFENEGLILRLGQPSEITDLPNATIEEPVPVYELECTPVMDDCEAGWDPMYEYDSAGCITGYECVRNVCLSEYSECLSPIAEIIDACGDQSDECLEQNREEYDACGQAYNECQQIETEEVEVGVTPNSFLWGADRFFERVSLALTIGKTNKAKKRLEIALERASETEQMIEMDELEAAEKSQEEYKNILKKVREYVSKFDNKEAKKLSEIKARMEKHAMQFNKKLIRLKARQLSADKKKLVDSLEASFGENLKPMQSEVRIKTEKEKKAMVAVVAADKYWEMLGKELKEREPSPELAKIAEKFAEVAKKRKDYLAAYKEGDYGKALGQATAALAIAKSAYEELKKQGDEDEVSGIEGLGEIIGLADWKEAWSQLSSAEKDFKKIIAEYGLNQQPWKYGKEVGNLYYEAKKHRENIYNLYKNGEYDKVKEYAASLKKTTTALLKAVETASVTEEEETADTTDETADTTEETTDETADTTEETTDETADTTEETTDETADTTEETTDETADTTEETTPAKGDGTSDTTKGGDTTSSK